MTAVSFKLAEAGKERMRRASIELGIRVLRSAHMDDSADWLGTLRPVGIFHLGTDAMRDVVVQARDWETIARSSRRSGLRYVASVMNAHRERDRHRGAIALLHQAADDIPIAEDDDADEPEARR